MLRDQGSTYPTRPPHQSTTRAPNGCKFRGSITRLLVSLSTPRGDGLPPLHARLASGCWSQLCRAGFQPAGFLRKVSEHQYSSSSPELSWRELCFGFSIAASFVSSISLATGYWLLTTILPSHAPRPPPGLAGSGRAQALPRWLLPDTDRRIPHELQGPILHFRTLPSATASSRGVGEPGTGAKVVKDRTGPDLDERVG